MKSSKDMSRSGLNGRTKYVRNVAIRNYDKFIISSGWDNIVRVWNFQNKNQEEIFEGLTNFVNSVVITSDRKFIVSGSTINL